MIKIIDNALTERTYNDLLIQIACGPFRDEVNGVDGVTYPSICRNIPPSVSGEVSQVVGAPCNVQFLRASPAGVVCPHPVHHDGSMGKISIMLYTSEIGGTAIMRHKSTGICSAPDDGQFVDMVSRDTDNLDAWEALEVAEAKPNRMAVFDARMMHAALPFGGSGDGVTSRTVYTRFAG